VSSGASRRGGGRRANTRDREKAFGSAEFKDYNPRVELHVSKFIEVIRKTEGEVSPTSWNLGLFRSGFPLIVAIRGARCSLIYHGLKHNQKKKDLGAQSVPQMKRH